MVALSGPIKQVFVQTEHHPSQRVLFFCFSSPVMQHNSGLPSCNFVVKALSLRGAAALSTMKNQPPSSGLACSWLFTVTTVVVVGCCSTLYVGFVFLCRVGKEDGIG